MPKHRFSSLDGLRGICAFIVVLFHTRHLVGPDFFAHGYLSVDVFFILSGFVLTFAYADAFARGLSVRRFLFERVRRLGPMLWVGVALGVLAAILKAYASGILTGTTIATIFALAVQNALLIPSIGAGGIAYPLNSVTWSLLAEILVNVAFALTVTRLSNRNLVAIIAIGWLALIAYIGTRADANFGTTLTTLPFGVFRAFPSFAVGVLLFRFWKSGAIARLPKVHPLVPLCVWTGLSACGVGPFPAIFDLVQIIVIAPLLTAFVLRYENPVPAWMTWAGRISYPLYATHLAFVMTAFHLGLKPSWIGICAIVGLAVLVADILARWVEPALRKALGQIPAAPEEAGLHIASQ